VDVPVVNPGPSAADLEVKDAQLIFTPVWLDLQERHGRDNLRFPREFIWLGGAPGAGKGTNTPFIARTRDIDAPSIVVSDLLTSPQAVAIKNAGKMVGDREVVGLLFTELLLPQYHDGVIVDGFPRTTVQVECLKLFNNAMLELHGDYRGTPLARFFRKPTFRIALLFVSEEVSLLRQLHRGRQIQEHNRLVLETGIGKLIDQRSTDLDPELCRNRYRTFKESTFDALRSLREIYHFHFIDAEGNLSEVQENILREFSYQSSLELSHEVYDLIRNIPVADQLALHARQELVERLEAYQEDNRPLLQQVVSLIEQKMMPIVQAHAITGHAKINSEDAILDDPLALRILIDIYSERGFQVTVDIRRIEVPERVDPNTWEIFCRTKKVYRIEVRYPQSDIRSGH
jgi:adenylate kinase